MTGDGLPRPDASAAPAATTTSSTRSSRRTTTGSRRSSRRSCRATTCRCATPSESAEHTRRSSRPGRRRRPTSAAEIDAIEAAASRAGRRGGDRQVPGGHPGHARASRPPSGRPLEQQLADLAYRQVDLRGRHVDADAQGARTKARRDDAAEAAGRRSIACKPRRLPTALVGDRRRARRAADADPRRAEGRADRARASCRCSTPSPATIEPPPRRRDSTGRRTALARWLTRPDNPLTTRVIVNRLWQYHFGRGLVAHAQRLRPARRAAEHPELLDWLARRVRRATAGALKPLHRLIMTSAAYRQSAERTASDGRGSAPEDRSRQPPALEAERPAGSTPRRSATPCWPSRGELDRDASAARRPRPRSRRRSDLHEGRSATAATRCSTRSTRPTATTSTAPAQRDHDADPGAAADQRRLVARPGQGAGRPARAGSAGRPTSAERIDRGLSGWPTAASPTPTSRARPPRSCAQPGRARSRRPRPAAADREALGRLLPCLLNSNEFLYVD